MKNKILGLYSNHKQFVAYSLIGASGALIDFILYIVFYRELGILPAIASFLSVSFGITNNFIWNAFFNFKTKDSLLSRFVSFYSIGIGGAILSALLIFIFHNVIGLDATIAKIITILPVVLLQFFLNKKYSFSNNAKQITVSKKSLLAVAIIFGIYLIFVSQLTYLGFQDEYDNILGGWLISHEGQVIYRDFFSHHMPLTYYISALITFITDNDVNAFRFVFVNGLFVWLLFIYRRMVATFGRKFAVAFLLLWAITHLAVLAHLILAETLIAYACLHALMLIVFDLYKTRRKIKLTDAITVSLLGAIPVLTSLNYITLSLLIYVSFAYCYIRQSNPNIFDRAYIKKAAITIAILSVPYIILGGHMIATDSLRAGARDAYFFNVRHYSQFTDSAGTTPIETYVNRAYTVASNASRALHLSSDKKGTTLLGTLSFVSVCVGIAILVINRKYFAALWLSAATYIVSGRGAIATDPYTQGTYRVAPYVILVCFMVTYLLLSVKQRKIIDQNSKVRAVRLTGFFLGVATFFTLIIQGATYNLGVAKASQQIETGISSPPQGGTIATIINAVNDNDDTYWIGPWDFYTQLYIDNPRASRYTFFLPWHGACGPCTNEFASDIKTKAPRVIYWQPNLQMLGHNVDTYSQPILDLLAQNYITFNDADLENFHFHKDNLDETTDRLKEAGYIRETD